MFLLVWCINKGLTSFLFIFVCARNFCLNTSFAGGPAKFRRTVPNVKNKSNFPFFILKISSTFAVVCVCYLHFPIIYIYIYTMCIIASGSVVWSCFWYLRQTARTLGSSLVSGSVKVQIPPLPIPWYRTTRVCSLCPSQRFLVFVQNISSAFGVLILGWRSVLCNNPAEWLSLWT